jgi:hypothetical protein
VPTLHVFCNCKLRLHIDLRHSHSNLRAALRQATLTPACHHNAAASPCRPQTHSAAAAAVASLMVTLACFNLVPTFTTAATAPKWLAIVLAEAPPISWTFIPNSKQTHGRHYYTTSFFQPTTTTLRLVDTLRAVLLSTYSSIATTGALSPHA